MAMTTSRRKKVLGRRRRIEDEGEDGGAGEGFDNDDDSLTEGSIGTEDHDADDSDTSNVDEASPTSALRDKSANGAAKNSAHSDSGNGRAYGKTKPELNTGVETLAKDDNAEGETITLDAAAAPPVKSPTGPVVVSSASVSRPQSQTLADRRRQEHEDYRKKRDEDPAFVPNRGSFFMHDHRHAGPAANGFRPFGRGRGRGGARGGFGDPFAPFSHMFNPADPTTNSSWTHDMHDQVSEPMMRRPRPGPEADGPPYGEVISRRPKASEPINRTMSTERALGNVQVRVFLPEMAAAKMAPGILVKQYTRLPDHRPPLRSDKPVRISLPDHPARYIYPAEDRSFTFIPRAMRPNQQRVRGKPRSGMGSISGFSRRTSLYGGSYYGGSYHGGSIYSPSNVMSRRSSIHDRDAMFSPTSSIMSRPPPPPDAGRPVVKLPPVPRPDMPVHIGLPGPVPMDAAGQIVMPPALAPGTMHAAQTQALPPRPPGSEYRPPSNPNPPLHQPKPQKNISVADIDSPNLGQPPGSHAFQSAFHHQVPPSVANGFRDAHSRQTSFSQHSGSTPLPQIPERAIHAAPFQPNVHGQQPYYGQQPPYQVQPQQPYYYNQGYPVQNMGAPNNAYQTPHQQPASVPDPMAAQGQVMPGGQSLVPQQHNGMVFYVPSQYGAGNPYQQYPQSQEFQQPSMPLGQPAADGYYYPPVGSGMMYYPQ